MASKLYFNLQNSGFYDSDINDVIPSTATEVSPSEYKRLLDGICSGKAVKFDGQGFVLEDQDLSLEDSKFFERNWRDNELKRADIELNKVQDSDSKAKGTVTQWREYRRLLRDLPEHALFPSIEARPVAPDA